MKKWANCLFLRSQYSIIANTNYCMKKLIIFSAFVFIAQFGFSQNYAYSFSGALTTEQITQIEKHCSSQPEVTSAKLKYKLGSQKGEIILFVEPNNSSNEGKVGFSAADIKQVIQSFGLTPIDFIELKTK